MSEGTPRTRRRPVVILVVVAGAAIVGSAGWWLRSGPALPAPPVPASVDGLDPDLRAAVTDALDATRARPRDLETRATLGMIYAANTLDESALRVFEQVAEAGGDDPRWRYHLALIRHRQGDVDAALLDVDAVLASRPDYTPALRRKGQWRLDLGDPAGAENAFRAALALDHADAEATLGLARAQLQRDDNETAAATLATLATTTGPHLAYASRLRGTALRRLGRDDEADAALRLAGDTPPAETPDPWRDELDAYRVGYTADLARARARAGAGDLAGAIEILEALQRRRDVSVEVYNNLALCYFVTGRIDDAETYARRGVEANDQSVQSHHLLATIAWQRGRGLPPDAREAKRREALDHVARGLAINPASIPSLAMRGDLLAAGGENEAAVATYLEAARWDPDNPEWTLLAATLLGRDQRWPEAAATLERAVAAAPRHGEALGRLGMAYLMLDRLDDAERILLRARDVVGADDPAVRGALAEVERRRRR